MKNTLSEPFDYDVLPVNLQLFATDDDDATDDSDGDDFDYNLGDDDADIEDSDDDAEGDEADADDEDPTEDEDEKDDEERPKGKPSKKFEAMRKKAEEAARKKIEAERAELEAERQSIRATKLQLTETAMESQAYATITPDAVWAKADEEGISEAAARKMLEADVKAWVDGQKQQIRGMYQQREAQKNQLRKEEFFAVLEKDVDAICDANPALPVKLVYDQLVGQRYRELMQMKNTRGEKGAIANAQDRMRRRNVSGVSKGGHKSTGQLSEFGREAAIAMGLDPRDIAKHKASRAKQFRIT